MNSDQFMSIVRDALQIIGTFLTTYGLITGAQWQPIAGGLLMIAPVAWGIYTHTQANTIASVAKMNATEVKGNTITILDPDLAKVAKENATPPTI